MKIDYVETRNLELKRQYTDNILKTVSAFSNYDGSKILIGADEKQKIINIDPYQIFLDNVCNLINI